MQGRTDGTFAPENMTTRAEAATVIERLDKKILEYQAEKEQQQEEVQEEGNE